MKELFTPESYQKIVKVFSEKLNQAMTNPPPPPFAPPYVIELEVIHKDGHHIWSENRVSFIRNENGKPVSLLGETIDITARKLAEDKLKAEEQRLRALAEQSADIIMLISQEGRVTYVNPAVSLLGYGAEERIGTSALDLVHPDDRSFVQDAHQTIFNNPESPVQKGEIRLRHKEGTWHIFEAIATGFVRHRMVEAAMINLRDITERKRTEEMLLLIKDAVEGSSDAISIGDSQGNLFYQNEAFTRLFGYTLEELKASRMMQTLYADKGIARNIFLTAMQGGSWNGEIETITKDGRKLNILLRANAIKDGTGKIVGLVGVNTDITERKKTELLIKESEEKYRLLADHMKDQVWLMDMAMNITYTSPSVEKSWGIPLKKSENYPFRHCSHPSLSKKPWISLPTRCRRPFL